MNYTCFDTKIGHLYLIGDNKGICRLFFNINSKKFNINNSNSINDNYEKYLKKEYLRNDVFFEEAKKQLLEYFDGRRKIFNLKLNIIGTEFQKKVWNELLNIPYAELRTYKDIAIAVGNPNGSRAIGMANNKNPIPIIIPCHRVIGTNNNLVGYAYGIEVKKYLIELENNNKFYG